MIRQFKVGKIYGCLNIHSLLYTCTYTWNSGKEAVLRNNFLGTEFPITINEFKGFEEFSSEEIFEFQIRRTHSKNVIIEPKMRSTKDVLGYITEVWKDKKLVDIFAAPFSSSSNVNKKEDLTYLNFTKGKENPLVRIKLSFSKSNLVDIKWRIL